MAPTPHYGNHRPRPRILPSTNDRSLKLHKVYWSKKPVSNRQLTIFTALNPSRLDALEAQCRSWPGPHSSVIYIPLVQQESAKKLSSKNKGILKDAEKQLGAIFKR